MAVEGLNINLVLTSSLFFGVTAASSLRVPPPKYKHRRSSAWVKWVFKIAVSSLQVPLPKSYRVLMSSFFHWGERVFKTAVSSLQVPSPNSKRRRSLLG